MKKFELLDIATADMAFAAYGKTRDEMFENAGHALMSIMFEGKFEPKQKFNFEIAGVHDMDKVTLLQNFLSELLYLHETERLIFSKIKVTITDYALGVEIWGEKYNPKKHKFIIDVKAITYHKMQITHDKKIWKCVVVVDV